ncbi:MAG: ATP-binding protein, partial [Bacteroidia bacterium]|nr:ATP-binding protein [Bacteroidia bacterium]
QLSVNFNAAYLESIIYNLISNAIKYSKKDNKQQSFIQVSSEIINNKIVLSILDNGIGIDLIKNKDKLFGMYKTFHDNEDARGIGLFITKNQIEAMGGTIDVFSELGLGTTFKITFK